MQRVFQIGFNKCATSALFKLFQNSGYNTLHSGGRHWRRRLHAAIVGRNPQEVIQQNIEDGREPLEGFDFFQVFVDMEYKRGKIHAENFRHYPLFARRYPNAKFILNVRDKQAWLRSRARHHNGLYIQTEMRRMNLDRQGVLDAWSDDFDRHNDAVQQFFAAEPDRLLVFDIDNTSFRKLRKFVRPEIELKPRHWSRGRVTSEVAKQKSWTVEAGAKECA